MLRVGGFCNQAKILRALLDEVFGLARAERALTPQKIQRLQQGSFARAVIARNQIDLRRQWHLLAIEVAKMFNLKAVDIHLKVTVRLMGDIRLNSREVISIGIASIAEGKGLRFALNGETVFGEQPDGARIVR